MNIMHNCLLTLCSTFYSSPISVDMMPSSSSRMERAQTPVNPRPIFMVDSEVKFAQDLSEYWYKPIAAREEVRT